MRLYETTPTFAIVHLVANLSGRTLISTPSNSAADHLTTYLLRGGINVIRMKAKTREMEESSIFDHTVVGKLIKNITYMTSKKRIEARTSTKADRAYVDYLEMGIIRQADVVVTTCMAGADRRLESLIFETVIVDEATRLL